VLKAQKSTKLAYIDFAIETLKKEGKTLNKNSRGRVMMTRVQQYNNDRVLPAFLLKEYIMENIFGFWQLPSTDKSQQTREALYRSFQRTEERKTGNKI
jgi:hypothetical protein